VGRVGCVSLGLRSVNWSLRSTASASDLQALACTVTIWAQRAVPREEDSSPMTVDRTQLAAAPRCLAGKHS
jgi:hypothetical protein